MLHVENLSTLKTRTQQEKITVVDFYAEWCGPCKVMTPILDELSYEYLSNVQFIKVDVDAAPELANHFGVMTVPTIKFIVYGEVVDSVSGFVPKVKIKERILKYI